MKKEDLCGKKMQITGIVVEHLQYASKEWVSLKLANNSIVTINIKDCIEIPEGK